MGIEIQMPGNAGSAEHRRAMRYRLRGEAMARPLDTDALMPGRVLDISPFGCLLAMPFLSPFEIGSLVDMSISTISVAFRALGVVRHLLPDHWRVGVSFVNLNRCGETELCQLIESLKLAHQAGRAATHEVTVIRHVERPPQFRFSPSI